MSKMGSTWESEVKGVNASKLKGAISCDTLVIGGGLAGCLTAYMLRSMGKEVVLVEKGRVGSGVSAYTTAFLTQDVDTDLSELIEMFGIKKAKLVWESHKKAIELVARIVEKEKIDCEFKICKGYVIAVSEDHLASLEKEGSWSKKLGFATALQKGNLNELQGIFGYLEIANQAKFHPVKFVNGLGKALIKAGVQIYENTQVKEIREEGYGHFLVATKDGDIACKKVVVTTYDPIDSHWSLVPRNSTYTSYVVEIETQDPIKEGIFWDMNNPYYYIRVDKIEGKRGSRVIVGGEDHKPIFKKDPNKKYELLEEYFDRIFPKITKGRIVRRWNGPILETLDGLAYIGEYSKNRYVGTGFSGNGMTYSAITAVLLSDLIMNGKSKYAAVYSPIRIPTLNQLLKKGMNYSNELVNSVVLR